MQELIQSLNSFLVSLCFLPNQLPSPFNPTNLLACTTLRSYLRVPRNYGSVARAGCDGFHLGRWEGTGGVKPEWLDCEGKGEAVWLTWPSCWSTVPVFVNLRQWMQVSRWNSADTNWIGVWVSHKGSIDGMANRITDIISKN